MDNRWKFELSITGLTEAQCDEMLGWITAMVETGYGGTIGGGFKPEEPEMEAANVEENP